jgi:hypothetical protein
MLVPLVLAWRGMVIITSCKQQHIIFDCCMGVALVLPSHLSVVVIAPRGMTRNDCRVVDVVILSLRSILLLAFPAFAIIDEVDLHQS